jgi:hypothetical protein
VIVESKLADAKLIEGDATEIRPPEVTRLRD